VLLGVIKLKKKEFEDLKHGSMSVSEYVTHFTQLSSYAPDNVDMDEKKQDWFLSRLDKGQAYALEAHNFDNFQDIVEKALVLENQRGIIERKRKMQRTGAQGSHKKFCDGSSSQAPIFLSGQHNVCKLQRSDFKLGNKFNTLISRLLAQHRHHRKGTTMHKILVVWDCATVVARMGTMQLGVQGSRQSRLQLQTQTRT
jgi:hypothetical protein